MNISLSSKIRYFFLGVVLFVGVSTVALAKPSLASARSTRTYSSDVYVRGYTRANGTVVRGYYRTPKDSTRTNNFSCLDYGRC